MTMSNKKTVTPMDDGIREQAVGTAVPNRQRQCWAIKTLVAEVDHLFPDTPATYGDYNARNAALSVEFDFMNTDEREYIADLLTMLGDSAHNEDARIASVEVVGWQVKVTMKTHPILMDTRDPFGLPEAWAVLFADEDEDTDEDALTSAPFYGAGDGSQTYEGSF
jgi:hypothetical protein